jgi:hypothetical protein
MGFITNKKGLRISRVPPLLYRLGEGGRGFSLLYRKKYADTKQGFVFHEFCINLL